MKIIRFLLLGILITFFSCRGDESQDSGRSISVSILPQKYFIEQIAGEHFNVNVLVPPGANPVSYDPSPKQMRRLSNSEAYLKIGYLAFEKVWLPKIRSINPDLKILDQSLNVDLIKSTGHIHGIHTHSHNDNGIDPHIWTSPRSVKKQIKTIYRYLIELDPEHSVFYRKNYLLFSQKLDSLDVYISESFKGLEDKTFMIYHPSLSYLARDYDLKQVSVEMEGKEPSTTKLKEMMDIAKKHDINTVFIQEQFSTHSAKAIARELNAKVVTINPLEYTWLEGMKDITDKLAQSMRK